MTSEMFIPHTRNATHHLHDEMHLRALRVGPENIAAQNELAADVAVLEWADISNLSLAMMMVPSVIWRQWIRFVKSRGLVGQICCVSGKGNL